MARKRELIRNQAYARRLAKARVAYANLSPQQKAVKAKHHLEWSRNHPELVKKYRQKCCKKRWKVWRDKIKSDPVKYQHWRELQRKSSRGKYQRRKLANPEHLREMSRITARRLRNKVLTGYGNVCEWPGCEETQNLEIAHVKHDGLAHRKHLKATKVESVYRDLVKRGFPTTGKFSCTLLCHGHHVLYDKNSKFQKDKSERCKVKLIKPTINVNGEKITQNIDVSIEQHIESLSISTIGNEGKQILHNPEMNDADIDLLTQTP